MQHTSSEMLCECGEDIASRRAALGFRTCLDCGEQRARQVAKHNQRSVVTLHKGNTIYLGQGVAARQTAKDVAAMRRGVHG